MPFKSEEVLFLTDEGVPSGAPNGLRVTSFNFTSDLLVEWSPLSQQHANGKVLGYTIYYRDYNYFWWSPYKSVNTSNPYSTQVTLTGLKQAHEYLVAVAAFTSKGVGPRSAHKYAITGCSITLNRTFGQIEFTTTSYHDVRCNWKIHSAGISKAVAFISVQELNLYYCSEFVKIIDGNGTEVLYHLGCVSFAPEILADVPFGLSNNILIQIYTQSYGDSINLKYAILKEGLTSAIPVLGWNVTIFNLSSTNFNLQWTKLYSVVNQHANFYIIEVKSVQGTVLNLETVSGNITSTVIKGLKPTSKYRVGVFGIDSVGQPYKSLESITTTKEVFCGIRPSTSRIVGGTEAPVNSWPWQVMVTDEYGDHFCGGSLVDRYWVVTAAHCVAGITKSDVKIRLGAHYRTYGSVGTEQDIDVAEIIMHGNYDIPLDLSNDIALLNLASPAELGVGVGLVCLPDTGHQLPFDDLNKRCWITGWGKLSSWGSSPNTLMQASLPLVSKQRCENAYPGKIDDSMLCAGLDEGGVDTCQGDSGGPLVCEFSGRWYLEGVTSWGYGCAAPDHYGVYANVRDLSSWLSTNMYTVVAPSASPQNQSLPQNQSSSAIVWCNFDHGVCSGWNQSSSDDFDWTLASGSTSSSSTGPIHGQGGSGKYMYIEASYPRKPGEIAKLVVTVPNNGNQSCLSFYYHMYGTSVGTLNVYSGNIKVFTATGNQGNDWLKMAANLYLDGVITFEGIIGSSYTGDVAIDEVKITKGSCPGISCSFDNGLCLGWSQSTSDVFDWTLNSGPTPSWSTGPSSDLSGTGKYMYTEATVQSVGDNAKLQLVVPRGYSTSCLTFFYHMFGYSMGTLNVFNGNTRIFTASGDHGDYWRKVIRTVNSGDVLTFEGIIGWSYAGDIAIDDVAVSEGNCPDNTSCNFDRGLCDGWQQSYSDVFDWTINTGSTWSSDTGPDYDHTTGTGYYMYIETSWPRVAGDNAKLELSVPRNGELSCLEFYYHMYGDTMGILAVFSGSAVVFNASGNHNNTWIKAEISIQLDSIVTFEGIVGSSMTGDLAIDDVSISSGNCQEHTAFPTTFSTSSTFSPSVMSNPPTFNSPSSQASSSSGPPTSSPPSSQASSSSELSTSSPPSSQASSSSELSTSSPPSSQASSSLELSTSSPPSSEASSSSELSTFIPSIKEPSSSSSLPSPALSGTSKSFTASPTPSIEETQETVMMEIRHLNITAWNDQMESDFKTAVAKAAQDYCSVDPPRCGLTTSSSRRKRSSDEDTFTGDMVHILPGYPKKSTDDPSITLLAFYLQLSRGLSNNIVNKDVLKAIVENDKSSIGGSVGGTIIKVQPLISTPKAVEESDEESNPQNAIIIGTSVGVVILVAVIIALLFSLKRRKRLIDAKKKADKGFNNNAYFNDAYCIDPKEQAIEMKRGDQTCSTGNVPCFEGHHYAAVNDLHASNNHSAVVLKFPDSLEGKNSVGFAAPIYQTLISGVDVPIYQPLNSGVDAPIYQPLNKSPGVRPERASEGVAKSVCQPANNGVAESIYQTLNNKPKSSEAGNSEGDVAKSRSELDK